LYERTAAGWTSEWARLPSNSFSIYEGLGTPGRHPYIVGDSEARGVLDIVRAARQLANLHASDRYLVWGHSQGGHAAMFSLHIADQWVPELHLVGVVAGAPPSQLLFLNSALQNSPFRYYLLMAAAGFNAAYGDGQAPLDDVLTPLGIQKLDLVDQGCTGTFAAGVQGLNFSDLEKADPASVPSWHQLLVDNDPGQFTQPSQEPLLMIQGGSDEQIPVISTQILFGQMCALGQGTQRWIYPGQSHAGVIGPSFGDMLNWIADRFAGKAAPSVTPTGLPGIDATACASTLAPTTTTTSTTTSTTTTLTPTTTSTTPVPTTSTTTASASALRHPRRRRSRHRFSAPRPRTPSFRSRAPTSSARSRSAPSACSAGLSSFELGPDDLRNERDRRRARRARARQLDVNRNPE
jgi:pimeloyl-ACP methyl ester carboxylesterase